MKIEELKNKELYNKKLYGHYELEFGKVMYLVEGADALSFADVPEIEKVIRENFPSRCSKDRYAYTAQYIDLQYTNSAITYKGRIAKVNVSFIRITTEIHRVARGYGPPHKEVNSRPGNVEFYMVRNDGEWHIL